MTESADGGRARRELDGLVRTQLAEETGLRGICAGHARRLFSSEPGRSARIRPSTPGRAALRRLVEEANIPRGAAIADEIGRTHARWEREVAAPLLVDPKRETLRLETMGKTLSPTSCGATSASAARCAAARSANAAASGSRGASTPTVAISSGLRGARWPSRRSCSHSGARVRNRLERQLHARPRRAAASAARPRNAAAVDEDRLRLRVGDG